MESKNIDNEEVSLKELVGKVRSWYSYLISQWKIIIIFVILGSSLGIVYSTISKTIYKATLSFVLEDEKSAGGGLGSALGLASSLGLDLGGNGGSIFSGSNLTELFKSRKMVEQTLLTSVMYKDKKVSLAEMYLDINNIRDGWKGNSKFAKIQFLPDADRSQFDRAHDSILGVLYQQLSKSGLTVGQKDKKLGIISIDLTSSNELFAKYFCEALVNQVGKFYIETKSKKARNNMSILDRQVDSIRGELNGSITGVAVANDNTFNLNPAMNVRRAPSSKRQVDVQANTAILTELVKQAELAKVTLRKETPLIQVIDRPIFPLPKERFGKLKGLILGGFLSGFLIVFFLIIKKLLKDLV